ncbi:unnamed protein product [marine sediment metagenome]|uniref:Uncharacterized protein n=1 Tax=marine sediment metagenome TaxID=412755 RepID=X1EDN0_9ZZZZ
MNTEDTKFNLLAHFKEAGLPLSTTTSRNTWGSNVPIVRLSVNERPVEHFMVDVGDKKNRVEVLSIDENFRQLVLLVKEPKREYTIPRADSEGKIIQIKEHTDPTERRYLMGLDEKHLFISGLPKEDINTVGEAHQALKHGAVVEAEGEGREVKRQGEYFFIPLTEKEEREFLAKVDGDKEIKCKKDKLSRRGQRPHFIKRLIRMRRRRKVYAHGTVTHEQHNPLILNNWHMVYRNRETESPGIGGFVD